VLKKNKSNSDTLFIDASEEFIKVTNNNKLTPDNIAHITEVIESRQDIPHFSKLVSLDQIQENDYNLSVSTYVEQKEVIEKSRLPTKDKNSATKTRVMLSHQHLPSLSEGVLNSCVAR
jgi:type I restriction-modification system DNA methylase subunit